MLGIGDKMDAKLMHAYKAGDFVAIAGKTRHCAQAKTAAVIQLHGDGPFDLSYADPADNPQRVAAKK